MLKRTFKSITLGLVAFCAAGDWFAVDRWQTQGTVADASTGQPISGAWVFVRFNGESPLIRLPIPPHPLHRTTECMGSRFTRTDERGDFKFDELTVNRPLANKSAYVVIFHPGWLSFATSAPLHSSVFAPAAKMPGVILTGGPGNQQDTSMTWPPDIRSRLDNIQFTYSDELFRTLEIVAEADGLCGSQTNPMAIAAMNHALSIALSLDERRRTRSMCRYAAKHLGAGSSWPFDCNNLAFKHPPGSDVLAIEFEIQAAQQTLLDGAPVAKQEP